MIRLLELLFQKSKVLHNRSAVSDVGILHSLLFNQCFCCFYGFDNIIKFHQITFNEGLKMAIDSACVNTHLLAVTDCQLQFFIYSVVWFKSDIYLF